MSDHIQEGKREGQAGQAADWSGVRESAYSEMAKNKAAGGHASLPGFEVATGAELGARAGIAGSAELHEKHHAGTRENTAISAPDLDRLKDPKNGLDVIKDLKNWVDERDKNSCLDPKQLANMLQDFAHKSIENWPKDQTGPQPPDNEFEVYEQFDKLLDKLDELNSKDQEWNDENSPNSRESFYRKLPWHFMPGE